MIVIFNYVEVVRPTAGSLRPELERSRPQIRTLDQALAMDAASKDRCEVPRLETGILPGLRILLISIGFLSKHDRASDVRRIWPPPSPKEPSMRTATQATLAEDFLRMLTT